MSNRYSAWITYRPIGDDRPESECPKLGTRGLESEVEFERDLERAIHQLEHQPTEPSYEILRVERIVECGRCDGLGHIRVRPKGWRRREAPPWFMLVERPCPDCAGSAPAPK